MEPQPPLDDALLQTARRQIEARIVPEMEAIYADPLRATDQPYDPSRVLPDHLFPELKDLERTVSYFDYRACGISVLAPLAAGGDERARALVLAVLDRAEYYCRAVYRKWGAPCSTWNIPLRRLLAHLGLAWPHLEKTLPTDRLDRLRELLPAQVAEVFQHNHDFWPGVRGWLFLPCNNHTAVFAQGVWRLGRALGRDDWVTRTEDFAQRYLDDMHPDGYFDENTRYERLGGPSMVYTPLTAGCLFDILDGRRRLQEAFLRAGRFHRRFLTPRGEFIPLADERTNVTRSIGPYGLALHSLTPEGRGLIRDWLTAPGRLDHATTEWLAVLYHELDLMTTGETAVPENRQDGDVRITLPVGVVRRAGWVAALCGLRATNREFHTASDYALDQQAHVYLYHERAGLLLPATKGKNDPDLSTCRQGADAYTVATGEMLTRPDRIEVTVHYRRFDVRIAWEIAGGEARLMFQSDSPEEITTTLPIKMAAEPLLRTDAPFELAELRGFSPYTAGNREHPVRSLVFHWTGRLEMRFVSPPA